MRINGKLLQSATDTHMMRDDGIGEDAMVREQRIAAMCARYDNCQDLFAEEETALVGRDAIQWQRIQEGRQEEILSDDDCLS